MNPLVDPAAFCVALALNLLSPAQIEHFFKQAKAVLSPRMAPVPMSPSGIKPSSLLHPHK